MSLYQFAQFHFDHQTGALYERYGCADVQEIMLRHKIARLLEYLIQNRDRVVTKDELLNALWDHAEYRESALTQSIRELRKALGDKAQQPLFIRTFPQRGYQWIAETTSKEASTDTEPETPSKRPRRPIYLAFALLGILTLLTLWWWSKTPQTSQLPNQATSQDAHAVPSVLVLPFVNNTKKADMAWLELGLADMLALELQHLPDIQITPPASARNLLLAADLALPSLPMHLRTLIREHEIGAALVASVRLHNQQQVLDFQLIHADGRIQQGSISYPSLPAAVKSIARQLSYLLQPHRDRNQVLPRADHPLASQALAEGLHTLRLQGAHAAQRFFAAAEVLSPDNLWSRAYLAQTQLLLGQWTEAEQRMAQLSTTAAQQDLSLLAFIHYWQAELAMRRGIHDPQSHISMAIRSAETANDVSLLAQSYRLQAGLAWRQLDWTSHQQWLEKAQQLRATEGGMHIHAENLFYLGNPSNEGLEKSPFNDLQKNKQRLQQARNFYQQLNDQPMLAASQLAIAQNYHFSLAERETALQKALEQYRQLKQPYELAQVLIYAGFYQMQLHNGARAADYFREAQQIADQLQAQMLMRYARFYQAFATLDQGLDQTAIGGHSRNTGKLRQATQLLLEFVSQPPEPLLYTSAQIFLGWAYTELEDYVAAERHLQQALTLKDTQRMPTTFAYASYSLMRLYLLQADYDAVIALAKHPISTRLQANYLARAYYEQGDLAQAQTVLITFKQRYPTLWHPTDELRLSQYQHASSGQPLSLQPEPAAHLVYCESDWAP